MKYTALKNGTQKNFTIPVLNGGVNFSENSDEISSNEIAYCKNIWNKSGRLETRPALRAKIENVIGKNIVDEGLCYDCFLQDNKIFLEGKYYSIATAEVFLSDSAYFVYVFLIDEDGAITEIGNIPFFRVEGNTFFIPENITFYSGEKQDGGGIFGLVTLVNMIGFEEKYYEIYEIESSFDGWKPNKKYYVPTVYINGRGNNYELAKQLDIAYTGAPKELEPLNLLDGSFYAYYSSDGYSTSFRLPFSNISDENVICRIYVSSLDYIEWCILSDSNSEKLDFYGKSVTLKLDREKGIISFYCDNQPFAIPQMEAYKENNVRILAKKDIPNAFERIISCKHSAVAGSKNVFSGGLAPSEIYFSRYNNPLYFPMVAENCIGTPTNEITAITHFKNNVIVFKNTEIYTVEITDTLPINMTNLLADNPNIFYEEAKIKIRAVNNTTGCANKHTIANINGCLIWQNAIGDICSLSDNKMQLLSNPIKPYLDKQNMSDNIVTCAAIYKNCYILCSGSNAVIMEFKDGEVKNVNSWYIWEFPKNSIIIGAYYYKDKPVFICTSGDRDIYFTATLGDGKDSVFAYKNGITKEDVNIESIIETKEYCFKEIRKSVKLTSACIEIEPSGNTDIKFISTDSCCDFRLTKTDTCHKGKKWVKFITNLKCQDFIKIEIKSKEKLKLGRSELYYTETN